LIYLLRFTRSVSVLPVAALRLAVLASFNRPLDLVSAFIAANYLTKRMPMAENK